MPLAPLFDPALFRIAPGIAHLCAGGETAFLWRHDAALRRYAEDKSDGMPGRERQEAEVERARRAAARLWQVEPAEIGFVGSVAEGVSMVAESLSWQPGDNVCVDASEYPSVAGPFALQRWPRIELRTARGTAPDRLATVVDRNTRVIAASHVSYLTGERVDLAALRRLADAVGALLVVDFTQAAGYLPIEPSLADFAFCATYKWLLGTTGLALAYWNRRRCPAWAPTTGGWHSIAPSPRPDYGREMTLRDDALRFTRGNPAHAPAYVLASALDYLEGFPMALVQRHVQTLTGDLMDRLAEAGLPFTTPRDPQRHGASVCLDSSAAQAIAEALYERGVLVWNGRGRIRVSFHGYNGGDDVDRVTAALLAVWRP